MATTFISIMEPSPKDDTLGSSALYFWKEWALSGAKAIIVYCGVSIGILFLITCLIVTGGIIEEDPVKITQELNKKCNELLYDSHFHTLEFYTFVMTLLVSIRAGLYYMARALERAVNGKDANAIDAWLIIQFLIMVAETLLGIALFKCLPGILSVIILFLFVELLAQASLIWGVWNFKLELNAVTNSFSNNNLEPTPV